MQIRAILRVGPRIIWGGRLPVPNDMLVGASFITQSSTYLMDIFYEIKLSRKGHGLQILAIASRRMKLARIAISPTPHFSKFLANQFVTLFELYLIQSQNLKQLMKKTSGRYLNYIILSGILIMFSACGGIYNATNLPMDQALKSDKP